MKTLKFTLFLFLSVSILSCGSDDAPVLALSNATLAGTYVITSANEQEKETTTSSSGTVVNVSTTTSVGDTFQVNFVLNSNNTYTAVGQFRLQGTETPNGGTPVQSSEIFNFDTSGSYQLNTTARTITFNPSNDEFINGTYEIVTFNENTLSLAQEKVEINGGNTITTNLKITFTKK